MSVRFQGFFTASIVMLGLMAAVAQLDAANYYVDFSGGNDAAQGTDTTTAWKHCPGDPVAIGKPGSAALAPGDNVFFKGGVTYVFGSTYGNYLYQSVGNPGISLNWFGTPGLPITYDGNSSGAWGTGRAVFTDNCSTNEIGAFLCNGSMSNLVFNSLEIGPIGGAATLPPDTGAAIAPNPGGGIESISGTMENVTIANCYFHGLGYWFNQKPMGINSIKGGGIGSVGCNHVTITNCEFTQMYVPIGFSIPTYVSNLTVVNCYFHNSIVWCMWFGFQSPTASMDNVYIHDNNFLNNDQDFSTDVWTGYGFPPHQDGINLFADSVTNINSGPEINIYNNYFHNTLGRSGGTACIFLVGNTSANIYNNVFANNGVNNGVVTVNLTSTTTPYYVRVLNNTFYETGSSSFYGGVTGTSQTTNGVVQLMNNIACQVAPGYNGYDYVLTGSYMPATNSFYIDYNCYVSSNWNNSAIGYFGGVLGYMVLPALGSRGWDIHGFLADPQFANIGGGDFHVQSTSPAIGNGANLTSFGLPGLSMDRDGNSRPATGPWTVGAYQVAGAAVVTIAPPPTQPAQLPQVQGLHILH